MVNNVVRILSLLFVAISGIGNIHGFAPQQSLFQFTKSSTLLLSESKSSDDNNQDAIRSRRTFITTATIATGAAILPIFTSSLPAYASGGATAGKYTTIPIAKRRYYGRVQEAVHEFLLMAPAVIKGDLMDPNVQDFFDTTKTVVVEGKKRDINGICTKKDGDCKSNTIFDSRYNDMKTSMYLLGNAFRINQTKAPDNLPSVKAAKKFFKQMNKFELVVLKDPKSGGDKAKALYATALDCLDEFLDVVELPPTESGHYDKEFSTNVGESSRIT